jgi:predicted TIM-barrel fold metal-dependent hydrolase
MKIIDVEAHFYTEEYLHYLRSRKEPPKFETINVDGQNEQRLRLGPDVWAPQRNKSLSALLDMEKDRLAKMNEACVTVQVLSLTTPGCELFEPSDAIAQARRTNDKVAEAIRRHPDRFLGFAALACQVPEAAADELERTVKELGFKGTLINSHVRGGEYLDDKKYWVIFERAERLGVPIYLHPRAPSPQMLKPYTQYGYALVRATLGFAAEASLHAMRLIFSGVFDKYPGLKIILGHLGEALPFWLDRIDGHYGGKVPIAKKPSQYLRDNFLVTLSGMSYLPAFICVYLALGGDNILFGSDYPYEKLKEAAQFVERLPICDRDKHKICHANAEALLNLGQT